MFRPQGVYPAMLTPFDSDGRINEGELRRLTEFGIERGLHGLFPVSSVGEGIHMSFDEKCLCMDIVADQAAGRVPVTPGIVASTPQECARLAAHAESIGCAAVVATPPYYFKPGPGMVERFFQTIIDGTGLPLILYNIPLFVQPLGYDTIDHLCRNVRVAGMKDSGGSMVDFMHFSDVMRRAGSEAHMLTGREEMLLPTLMMGGSGCMTATAGIFPEIMVGIWNSFQAGDIDEARRLQEMVLVLIRAMFAVPLPVGFKLALELRGFHMGPPRLPLSDADKKQVTKVKALLGTLMEPVLAGFGERIAA